MDIETVRQKKVQLEEDMKSLMCQFVHDTGVEIRRVDVDISVIDVTTLESATRKHILNILIEVGAVL